MPDWDTTDFVAVEKNDDRLWLLVESGEAMAACQSGETVDGGGVTYRVVSLGRSYKHPQHGKVRRVYVVNHDDLPATGGATERQVVALRNFGIAKRRSEGATKAVASAWIDELINAHPDSKQETVKRINQVGE